ncbi:MAG: pitrilysin family protein [Candidatus Marinimicrobia bacterium]|nr:pitrilysin family protein [Candidatus Neomarinimicrobiota bacterium]MDP6836457.1 pitrilysin family protein [Candidatus Neomarinimicrobiota bacterium]MDP6967333.1 pitrilysin family protein [Candidatus Neomarinimicrobiota bacterium]
MISPMKRTHTPVMLLVAVFAAAIGWSTPVTEEIDIPHEKHVLDNGLTLIIHEDHKAPIVAVNVWYHVGSKNEKPGRTGFAHLFEHLMFNGSENFNDDYFIPLEKVGATDLNGTTNEDRTNYFQNVPSNATDLVLWMESDRMGHLLGAIDQDKLDEQRGVVQNEKRQGENQPYAIAYELITKNTFPKGHPYSWTVIGSMEDLDAAELNDVHKWFKDYYGAANAVIAIAGDIDAEAAKAKAEEYFGTIPPGPPVKRQDMWIAKMSGTHRQIAQDRVPLPRIYKVWNIPQWGSADADYLDLVSDVLAVGKNSRLYKRLVYEDQIATNVNAYVDLREIGGQFAIVATAQQGVDLTEVEKALDEEIATFLRKGPTKREMERIKTQYRARFIRGIERIGGFGGKSDILARNEVYGGTPDHYKVTLERIASASRNDLKKTAMKWLSDGVYILEIHPFPKHMTTETDVDRSKLPDVGGFPALELPDIQKVTLSNGLEIILAERHEIPVVSLTLVVDAGYAADQFGLAGTASMSMLMLDEGTNSRSALEISDELKVLGAQVSAGADLDICIVSLSALKENLDASLDVFADVILNPTFPKDELERLKKQRLASIKQEETRPITMALRVLPALLYGEGHAYSNPLTGSGTVASTESMTRDDLVSFHDSWLQPQGATMVAVGDITVDELVTSLENLFSDWKQKTELPGKNISEVSLPAQSRVYLMDKPGAIQSIIIAGHLAPPTNNPDEIRIETMNTILGGAFTSRINMNLREDKHWSYGARSLFWEAKGQRMFFAYAPVQTDKTKESLVELNKELRGIIGENPASKEELSKAQKSQTLRLPGRFETMNAVSGAIVEMVKFGIPEDYYETYPGLVRGLDIAEISQVAKNVLYPDRLTWLVVGDREKIEAGIKELGYGEVQIITVGGE